MKLKARATSRAASPGQVVAPKMIGHKTATAKLPIVPTDAEIAILAYAYWEARGSGDGSAEEDWYRVVEDLLRERSRSAETAKAR